MKRFVNGGIYDIDLGGKSKSEFCNSHPSIIVQSLKEREMYIIIPLTSFDENCWEVDKKNFCCRIISTNSIALIDKFQIRHNRDIKAKYFTTQTNEMMVITPKELNIVLTKLVMYVKASTDQAQNEYKKYEQQYYWFMDMCKDAFSNTPIVSDNCFTVNDSDKSNIVISFLCSQIDKLAIKDIYKAIDKNLKLPHITKFSEDNKLCKIFLK